MLKPVVLLGHDVTVSRRCVTVLHEIVTTYNKYESRVLQGKVTKCYKEESQCYKLVSLCVTRKFDKQEEERPSQ